MTAPRLVVALLFAIAACGGPAPTTVPDATVEAPPFAVLIDPTLRPRMAPVEVAAVVLEQIAGMERIAGQALRPARIVSVKALHEAAAWKELGSANGGDAIVWLVRAEGTFVDQGGYPGSQPAPPVATGWFIIRDANGDIAGEGFPAP